MAAKPQKEALDKVKQEIYLVADGHPLSKIEICNAALKNEFYAGSSVTNFTGDKIDGKRYNIAKIQSRLQWTPKFVFSSFMADENAKEISVPLLQKK